MTNTTESKSPEIIADERKHDVHFLSELPAGTRPPYELVDLDDGKTLIYVWDHTVLTADAHHDTRLEITAGYCQLELNGELKPNQLGDGCWRVIPAESNYRLVRLPIGSGPCLVKATKYKIGFFEPSVYSC